MKVRPAVVNMCRRLERENGGHGLIDADHLNIWLRMGQRHAAQEQQPSPAKAVEPPKEPSKSRRKAGRASSAARDPFAALDFSRPASLTASVEGGAALGEQAAAGEQQARDDPFGQVSLDLLPPQGPHQYPTSPQQHLQSQHQQHRSMHQRAPHEQQAREEHDAQFSALHSGSSVDLMDPWRESVSPGSWRREEALREKQARAMQLRAQMDPASPAYRVWFRRDWRLSAPLSVAASSGAVSTAAGATGYGSRTSTAGGGAGLHSSALHNDLSASSFADNISQSSSIPPLHSRHPPAPKRTQPPWQHPNRGVSLGGRGRVAASSSRPSSRGSLTRGPPPRSKSASALGASSALHSAAVLGCAAPHFTAPRSTAPHSTAPRFTVPHSAEFGGDLALPRASPPLYSEPWQDEPTSSLLGSAGAVARHPSVFMLIQPKGAAPHTPHGSSQGEAVCSPPYDEGSGGAQHTALHPAQAQHPAHNGAGSARQARPWTSGSLHASSLPLSTKHAGHAPRPASSAAVHGAGGSHGSSLHDASLLTRRAHGRTPRKIGRSSSAGQLAADPRLLSRGRRLSGNQVFLERIVLLGPGLPGVLGS